MHSGLGFQDFGSLSPQSQDTVQKKIPIIIFTNLDIFLVRGGRRQIHPSVDYGNRDGRSIHTRGLSKKPTRLGFGPASGRPKTSDTHACVSVSAPSVSLLRRPPLCEICGLGGSLEMLGKVIMLSQSLISIILSVHVYVICLLLSAQMSQENTKKKKK